MVITRCDQVVSIYSSDVPHFDPFDNPCDSLSLGGHMVVILQVRNCSFPIRLAEITCLIAARDKRYPAKRQPQLCTSSTTSTSPTAPVPAEPYLYSRKSLPSAAYSGTDHNNASPPPHHPHQLRARPTPDRASCGRPLIPAKTNLHDRCTEI